MVHITSAIAKYKSRKKLLVIAHYKVGVSTQSTVRGAKTVLQSPNYKVIRLSSYKDLAVLEK